MGLHIFWTSHIKDKEEKEKFEQLVRNSGQLLDRLNTILDIEMNNAETKKISDKAYDEPNWAYKQADLIGYLRACNKLKSILNYKG